MCMCMCIYAHVISLYEEEYQEYVYLPSFTHTVRKCISSDFNNVRKHWQSFPKVACITVKDDLSHRGGSSQPMTPIHIICTAFTQTNIPIVKLFSGISFKGTVCLI